MRLLWLPVACLVVFCIASLAYGATNGHTMLALQMEEDVDAGLSRASMQLVLVQSCVTFCMPSC